MSKTNHSEILWGIMLVLLAMAGCTTTTKPESMSDLQGDCRIAPGEQSKPLKQAISDFIEDSKDLISDGSNIRMIFRTIKAKDDHTSRTIRKYEDIKDLFEEQIFPLFRSNSLEIYSLYDLDEIDSDLAKASIIEKEGVRIDSRVEVKPYANNMHIEFIASDNSENDESERFYNRTELHCTLEFREKMEQYTSGRLSYNCTDALVEEDRLSLMYRTNGGDWQPDKDYRSSVKYNFLRKCEDDEGCRSSVALCDKAECSEPVSLESHLFSYPKTTEQIPCVHERQDCSKLDREVREGRYRIYGAYKTIRDLTTPDNPIDNLHCAWKIYKQTYADESSYDTHCVDEPRYAGRGCRGITVLNGDGTTTLIFESGRLLRDYARESAEAIVKGFCARGESKGIDKVVKYAEERRLGRLGYLEELRGCN